MLKNTWIIVMGYSGSGKTTVSKILHERGFISFEYSAYFRHVLNLQNEGREEISKRVEEYIQSKGRISYTLDLISWVEKNIPNTYDKPIYLIGARNSEDIKILKSLRNVIFCIYLCSMKENRIKRVIKRNKVIDKKIIAGIETKGNVEISSEIATCIKEHTNYFIENNGETQDLINNVDLFLNYLERLDGFQGWSQTT
jgi:dephospho-CoA kinase